MWYILYYVPKKHLTPLLLVEKQKVGSDNFENVSQNWEKEVDEKKICKYLQQKAIVHTLLKSR